MPYRLEFKFSDALAGRVTQGSTQEPFGSYFHNMGATIIHNDFSAPSIDFGNGQHIQNVVDILYAASAAGYREVFVLIDEPNARAAMIDDLHEFLDLPGILVGSRHEGDEMRLIAKFYKPGESPIHRQIELMSDEDIEHLTDAVIDGSPRKVRIPPDVVARYKTAAGE